MADRRVLLPLLAAVSLGCGSPSADMLSANDAGTGLQGTIRRGPIQPVCRVDEPCDAPLSAGFQVWRERHLVNRFRSDSLGRYQVALAPGAYTIVADSGTPIWPPQQPHDVTVGRTGLTHLDLDFDTGIR